MTIYSCDNSVDANKILRPNSLPPLSINWNSNNTIVCFGTSITNGKRFSNIIVVPSPPPPPDSSYPRLIGEKLKIKVVNKGYWGATTEYANSIFKDSVLSQNPALILLEFGANEFLRGYDPEVVKIQLDSLIEKIKSYNIKVVLLSFINPDMLAHTSENNPLLQRSELAIEYYHMLVDAAKRNGILIDDYILRGIWGVDENMSQDGLHPNNKGNTVLADNIFNSLYNTFFVSNMIK